MRVLHYQHNGVGVILSKALREIKVDSRVVATAVHPFGFEPDYLIPTGTKWKDWRTARKLRKLLKACDVFHSHSPTPPPFHILDGFNGLFVQHWHAPNSKPFLADYPEAVHLASVPTKGATWMPIPVDTSIFKPIPKQRLVTVGYCALVTDPSKSLYVPLKEIHAVNNASVIARIYPHHKIIPHEEMVAYYQSLDIWVDRIGLGFYGFQAVEAAACGVAVITQMDAVLPGCPFLNVKREEVTDALTQLIQAGEVLQDIKRECRRYAVEMHDSRKVAQQCLEFYKRA
jgi:glycosyltransferase involved in cell wall biosynthesis